MLIDFHVHVFPDKLAAGAVASLAARAHFEPFTDGTLADTQRRMRAEGVDRYVLLNIAVTPKSERHVNDFAIALRSDPCAIPFGSVHIDSPNALAEVRRLNEAGIRGVKFHNEYQDFYVDDERAFPVYEACAKQDMIMLFHGGADRGFKPPVKTPPFRMRRVATAFPQARIVVAHLGGQDMAEDAIQELTDTCVWIDTGFASRSVPPETAYRVIRAFGTRRTLFGTDCPWDTPAATLRYIEGLGFSKEELQDICYRNALCLLGESEDAKRL